MPNMVLTYPNPSLSEITQVPSRDGSSIRTSETQTTAKETAAPSPKKSTARQIVLTIMYVKYKTASSLPAQKRGDMAMAMPRSISASCSAKHTSF